MAVKSREQPPQFGGPERQAVTNEIHEAMLAAEVALVPSHTLFCSQLIAQVPFPWQQRATSCMCIEASNFVHPQI